MKIRIRSVDQTVEHQTTCGGSVSVVTWRFMFKNVLKERHLHAEQKAGVGPLMESHLVLSPMIDLKFCTDKLLNVQMRHLWKNCLLTNIYVDLTKVILYVCLWSWVPLSTLDSLCFELCSELLSSAFGPCSLSWGSVADSLGSAASGWVVGGSGTGSGCRKMQTFHHHHFNKTKEKTEENFSVLRHPNRWFHTSIWVQPNSRSCWT